MLNQLLDGAVLTAAVSRQGVIQQLQLDGHLLVAAEQSRLATATSSSRVEMGQ
jgi:hypothetical protein